VAVGSTVCYGSGYYHPPYYYYPSTLVGVVLGVPEPGAFDAQADYHGDGVIHADKDESALRSCRRWRPAGGWFFAQEPRLHMPLPGVNRRWLRGRQRFWGIEQDRVAVQRLTRKWWRGVFHFHGNQSLVPRACASQTAMEYRHSPSAGSLLRSVRDHEVSRVNVGRLR
jgi:hypothetical protein